MNQPALVIQNVSKTYANGFTALNDVSFSVEKGEFFALLGQNGAGKTTLISAMAGLAKQSSGSIKVMGFDTQTDAYNARLNLGVVPQELVFDPFFTVREALTFQSGYFGVKNNQAWIDELLHYLDLSDKANNNMRELSGGMKRRVLVAQALVHKPPVIVLDEPTAGVDVELRQSLWAFISQLNKQGHTIILTTHYLDEAQALCERVAMLKAGKLLVLDKIDNLLQANHNPQIHLKLDKGLPASLQGLLVRENMDGVVLALNDLGQIESVLQILREAECKVLSFNVPEMDLEDVFMGLLKEEVQA